MDRSKQDEIAEDILDRAARRITKSRTALVMKSEFVFWSRAALNLEPVPMLFHQTSDGRIIPMTLAVDGTHLFYNPILVASNVWTNDELTFLVAHEAGHCVLLDHVRRGARQLEKWNVATDHRLNHLLVDSGLTMPKGLLCDPKYKGWAAERVYLDLSDADVDKAFGGGEGDCGGAGVVVDAPAGPGESQSEARERQAHEWDIVARSAAYAAQAQGHLPAGFEHLLSPTKPALDPRALLRRFITMTNRNDYTWSRPNRRFIGSGFYLPSLRSESVGPVCIAIDTSVSITDSAASRFLGFVNAVLVEVKPERTWFLQCDAAIQSADEYGPGDSLPASVTIKGRGGTDMRPIWKWQQAHNVKPVCTIVLSDMCMNKASFGRDPGHPVLWLSSQTGARAPFGTTVDLGE